MVECKVVINDPKTGKSYQKTGDTTGFLGKKIGETVNGEFLGLDGYELQICGGSDFIGLPMRKDIEGQGRKRALLKFGVGMRTRRKGLRVRKTVCGNTITEKIAQVNVKVQNYGTKALQEYFTVAKEEAPAAE